MSQLNMTQAWKEKEKEMPEMYGTWEKKFQQLLNWNVAVMENSHDSVIEMDVHMVGYKMYFLKKKLCTWSMYSGFLGGLSHLP
jgi:hypothetical protein